MFSITPQLFYATKKIAKTKFHAGLRCGNIHFPLYTKHQFNQTRIRRFSIRLKNRAFRKKHTQSRLTDAVYYYIIIIFLIAIERKGIIKGVGGGRKVNWGRHGRRYLLFFTVA